MKIAYLFDQFPTLSETFLQREITALRKRGLEIEVWALKAGAGAHSIPAPPRFLGFAEKRLLNAEKSWFFRQTGIGLARALENRQITHIHAAWASHPAQIAQVAAEKLGLSWSFAGHARDLWVEGGRLDEKLEAASFANCCTRAGTEFLKTGAKMAEIAEKVFYLPHGLELENYRFRLPKFGATVNLLGVGRLVEKKGWLDLMQARGDLAAWERFVSMEIIGNGPYFDILAGGNTSMDGFRLITSGAKSHQYVIEAMLRADLLVVPSKVAEDGDRDGLPNVILEAAAIGLPIVATRVGAIPEFVSDETGWLCPPDSPRALAQTIRAVWENETEARRRCVNALAKVEADFNVDFNVAALADLFRNAIETTKRVK